MARRQDIPVYLLPVYLNYYYIHTYTVGIRLVPMYHAIVLLLHTVTCNVCSGSQFLFDDMHLNLLEKCRNASLHSSVGKRMYNLISHLEKG